MCCFCYCILLVFSFPFSLFIAIHSVYHPGAFSYLITLGFLNYTVFPVVDHSCLVHGYWMGTMVLLPHLFSSYFSAVFLLHPFIKAFMYLYSILHSCFETLQKQSRKQVWLLSNTFYRVTQIMVFISSEIFWKYCLRKQCYKSLITECKSWYSSHYQITPSQLRY